MFFVVHRQDGGQGGCPSTVQERQLEGVDAVVVSRCGRSTKMLCHGPHAIQCVYGGQETQVDMIDREPRTFPGTQQESVRSFRHTGGFMRTIASGV